MMGSITEKRSKRCVELLESRLVLASIAFSTEDLACCGVNVESVVNADLDADGDLDIVTGRWNEIAWRENLDSSGNFGEPRTISSSVEGNNRVSVIVADLDNDGDLDVVSAAFRFRSRFANVNKIAWYENLNGNANFSQEKIISTETDGVRSIFAADLDGDGITDILSASGHDNTVAWFQNKNGEFGERQVIHSNVRGASSVFAEDIDRDGDLDVLSASPTDGIVAWYENTNGLGDFSDPSVVTDQAGAAISVIAGDLDGDGDFDVAITSSQFAIDQEDKIAWHENLDGRGNFGEQNIISLRHDSPTGIVADDVDGDNDPRYHCFIRNRRQDRVVRKPQRPRRFWRSASHFHEC